MGVVWFIVKNTAQGNLFNFVLCKDEWPKITYKKQTGQHCSNAYDLHSGGAQSNLGWNTGYSDWGFLVFFSVPRMQMFG